MSTAPARLELVPPSAPQPRFVPPPAVPKTPAERDASVASARRIFLRLWITACAAMPAVALLGESLDEALFMTFIGLGMLVMPISGVVLWSVAIYARSRETLRALLAATVALVAGIALIEPAMYASVELFVAGRQVELDALAADVRRAVPEEAAARDPNLDVQLNQRFDRQMSDAGISDVAVVDGALLFVTSWGTRLLYVDGVAGSPPRLCRGPSYHALGGRWFALRCQGAVRDYGDW